jgi:hypothetical protein
MALNFADVAAKKLSEVERPPLPPVGTYRFQITKLPEATTTQNGDWDILNIPCRAVEALDDVDMEDYKGEVTSIMQSVRFMFNKNDEGEFDKSLYRAKTFFEKHVKCAEEGDSIAQAMNNSVNQSFLGTIAWRADKDDPELFHANISRTAPLD